MLHAWGRPSTTQQRLGWIARYARERVADVVLPDRLTTTPGKVLEERLGAEVDALLPAASERIVGRTVRFMGREVPVITVREALDARPDIALFSAGGGTSLEWAPKFAEKGTIDVTLPDAELAARRAAWMPRKTDYNSGAIWKYAQLVGPAHLGALTHPGGAAETHCYADI